MKTKVLSLLLVLIYCFGFAAYAEEAAEAPPVEKVAVETPAPAKVETPAPVVETPAPTAAPETTETATAEAVEPEASESAETPDQAEPAETAPTDEAAAEAPAAEAETSSNESASEPKPTQTPFKGSVKVLITNEDSLVYGDEVTLKAVVSGTNLSYTINWEGKLDIVENGQHITKWVKLSAGESYKFTVKESSISFPYRATIVSADGQEISSSPVTIKATEPEEQPEAQTDEQPEESSEATDIIEEETSTEIEAAEQNEEEPAAVPEREEAETTEEEPTEAETEQTESGNAEEKEDEEEKVVRSNDGTKEEKPETVETKSLTKIILTQLGSETVAVDVREQPDGMSPILITMKQDMPLTLVETMGEWVRVSVGGVTGYVFYGDIAAYLIDDDDAPAEADADAQVEMKVTIFTSRKKVTKMGETIQLTSLLQGFDVYEVRYVWECDKGAGFEPVDGENGDTLTYIATAESLNWHWRLGVMYR